MMISLKTFTHVLAGPTGASALGLYERQRALVRANILPTPVGRGRGNGLMATPATVAFLLLAILATDSLSETDERVARLADAKFAGSGSASKCELTGASLLSDAVGALLADQEILKSFVGIKVSRSTMSASIYFTAKRSGTTKESVFGKPTMHSGLEVEALLRAEAFRQIAMALELSNRVDGDD